MSTYTEFICWEEVALSDINAGLTQARMGSRKGVVVSGRAEKDIPVGLEEDPGAQAAQASDTPGPVTLLGIVETVEFFPRDEGDDLVLADGIARVYSYSLYNNSVPVPTIFFPPNWE